MIDRDSRDQLAEGIRALVSGRISNDEFEDQRLPSSKKDLAIGEIYSSGAWFLYSDHKEHRLVGKHRLSKATKTEVARWVVFLKSDFPYEWPVLTTMQTLGLFIANLVTLGIAGRAVEKKFNAHGDPEVWPFIRSEDYETALKNPVYLNSPQIQ